MKIINFFLINLFFVLNIAISQDGNTPTNLTIDAASVGGVQLSWDTPENYRRNWITHSNGVYLTGIGQSWRWICLLRTKISRFIIVRISWNASQGDCFCSC